jgi:tRNA(Ile)-lysidine synthase
MQGNLAQRVLRGIERQRMLRPGDRVGVAVSGGGDSVALLRLLEDLRLQLGVHLSVLHFNHQLRGADSDADEQFVAALAAQRGLAFIADRADVAAVARQRGWNLEDAARRLRYEFFRSAMEGNRLTRVAVAHSADDQAETVLARLVRGTGPAGLAAIYPVKGRVIRPLLDIRREELRGYLQAIGQGWREDQSNRDMQRLRARLRHEILPTLERELQPSVVAHLCRLAEFSREDEAFWMAVVRERLKPLLHREGARLGVRCADLLAPLTAVGAGTEADGEAQMALARRLVRGIVEELRGDCRRLTAQHVEQVMRLAVTNSSGHRTELPGVVAERDSEWIWFALAIGATRAKAQSPKGKSRVEKRSIGAREKAGSKRGYRSGKSRGLLPESN